MPPQFDLERVFSRFLDKKDGAFLSAEPYGSGHINDTYKVHFLKCSSKDEDNEKKEEQLYILQRINHDVFPNPLHVMENVVRVTHHLAKKIEGRGGDVSRELLSLLPPKENGKTHCCAVVDGNYWRVYKFIPGTITFEIGEEAAYNNESTASHVREEAAAAFAQFQHDVSDISAQPQQPRLHETISNFGDSSFRFQQLEEALLIQKSNQQNRSSSCQTEIEFCMARKKDAFVLSNLVTSGAMPERVVHYDTKINNVLFDEKTNKSLCVIDLDTTMPGLAIYDFGDCVRAASALSAEDETDLSKVGFSLHHFDCITRGYLSVANEFLTEVEIDHLAFAAKIVTFTIGLRFLADHLNGDVYFKTNRENHNLDRARTQLKMVADMESQMEEMKSIVQKYRRKK